MGKYMLYFAFLAIIIFLLVWNHVAYGDENEFYKAITPDNTVYTIEEVQVGRWTAIPYSINECDKWIAEWQRRAEECLYHKKEWENIKVKIMKEAEKVKLKVTDEQDT